MSTPTQATSSSSRRSSGNIHKIREFELEKVHLMDEFDILQIVGEGWFGKILLVEHKATDTEMVLKALPKPYVSIQDFYREFHYGLCLGSHKNIVTTYDVAFETAGFYVFTQEYAPLGDLTSNVSDNGIGELHSKRVARQIASALEYMHSKQVVHRDVKLDNVLVFRSDFSRVKLCDFGESRRASSSVQRRNEWLPYSPPEVLSTETDDTYKTDTSHDIWQFGIVVFICLTGCLPWQKAASDDPRYNRYTQWHSSALSSFPMKRQPKLFKLISAKACKMFRKFLEPRVERRVKTLTDLYKYLDDRWLAKTAEKEFSENGQDELCPSMYSFHSSADEKSKLLYTLAQHGIETTVDRVAKKNRIKDWIQNSVISEEDEEEDSGSATPSSTVSMTRTPVAGHISSLRAKTEAESEKQITTTIKDASNKHINPRTGQVEEGPSQSMEIREISHERFNEQFEYIEQNENYGNVLQNSFDENEEATAVSGKLDINIKDSPKITNKQESKRSKSTERDNKSNSPPVKETIKKVKESKPKKPTSTSFKQRVFGSGSNSNAKKTSDGLISAFNSLATVSVPEAQQQPTKSQDQQSSSNKDSAYGSIDNSNNSNSTRPNNNGINGVHNRQLIETVTTATSPIFSRRNLVNSIPSSSSFNYIDGYSYNQQNNNTSQNYPNGQYHHEVDEGTNMDDYDVDNRGSSGFVQNVGLSQQQSHKNQLNNSMKDSPYDAYDGNYSRIYKKYNHK